MPRLKVAAANWKMNTTLQEGMDLYHALMSKDLDPDVQIVLCPPATHIASLSHLSHHPNIYFGSQNIFSEESGAFTGELSASMISSIGASHVIIGHSERRQHFNESNEMLASKLSIALRHDLVPIFCCGESLTVRNHGTHVSYVLNQLKESLQELSEASVQKLYIAYEPIWAIGTGETASPEQAQEMHFAIRSYLKETYGEITSELIPILYGGSVKADNAESIFSQQDVDGGLVGGASLDATAFSMIVNSFE